MNSKPSHEEINDRFARELMALNARPKALILADALKFQFEANLLTPDTIQSVVDELAYLQTAREEMLNALNAILGSSGEVVAKYTAGPVIHHLPSDDTEGGGL